MFNGNKENETKLLLLIDQGAIDQAMELVKDNELSYMKLKDRIFLRTLTSQALQATNKANYTNFLDVFCFSDLGESKIPIQKKYINALINIATKDQYTDLTQFSKKQFKKEEIEDLVIPIVQYSISSTRVQEILNNINPAELRPFLYDRLVSHSHHQYNGFLLQELKKLDNQQEFDFNRAIKAMNLNSEGIAQLNKLISADTEKAIYVNKKISPFVNGFGNIKYEDGLLAIAERKERKKTYVFNPTLINNEDELKNYLIALNKAPRPVTQRFILSGTHWTSGEINISAEGKINVLHIDAVGGDNSLDIYMDKIKIFNQIFPNCDLYYSQEKRQNAIGCSVFAFDDAAHLFTLRLEDRYKDTKLFGYLAKHNEKIELSIDGETVRIILCKLPIALIRTMQSRDLLNKDIPERPLAEQTQPVNKKHQTAKESAEASFKEVVSDTNLTVQNTRLAYKLDNIAKNVFNFLITHSKDEVEVLLQDATVGVFAEKMAAATKAEKSKSPNTMSLKSNELPESNTSKEGEFLQTEEYIKLTQNFKDKNQALKPTETKEEYPKPE